MSEKMKSFQAQKSQPSSFLDRVKFLGREKKRDVCIANLRTWRSRLDRTISYATRKAERQHNQQQNDGPSSSELTTLSNLRSLSRRLFKALSRHWACGCGTPHQARLSLAACVREAPKLEQTETDFGFLVSHRGPWHEMMVLMKDIA